MMKKVFYIIFYLNCAALNCAAQFTINTVTEESLAKQIIATSRFKDFYTYNSNIKYFLTTAYGNLEYGPKGLITYIHETAHLYDNIKSTGLYNKKYYWCDSNLLLGIEVKKDFVTSESMLSLLPDYVQDKVLTKTYISCPNNCFSRTYGIYGLLEEFNAYSLEPRSLLDMYDYFDTCSYTNKPKFWEGYLKCKYDSWMNFYYFNIFFSTYLKYIEGNQKDFYNQLISDTGFKNTFTKIYSKYSNALACLNCMENKVLSKINKGKSQKYIYPFMEEYNTVKDLSESESTQKYLSLLLNK